MKSWVDGARVGLPSPLPPGSTAEPAKQAVADVVTATEREREVQRTLQGFKSVFLSFIFQSFGRVYRQSSGLFTS